MSHKLIIFYFLNQRKIKKKKAVEAFNCFNFTKQPYAPNAFMDIPFLISMPQLGMECPFRLGLILLSTSGWLHPFLSNSFKWHSPQLRYWLADHPSPELRLLLLLDTRWCLWETLQLIKKVCHWLFKNNPEGPVVKNPPCNAEDAGSIPGAEDPTCSGAAKAMCHSCWACAPKPSSHSCWAHVHLAQLLSPRAPGACARQREKSRQQEARVPQRKSRPHVATKTPRS